jgi:hypothetical protein
MEVSLMAVLADGRNRKNLVFFILVIFLHEIQTYLAAEENVMI